MKRPNFIVIPVITLIVAISGSIITAAGMDWYKTINLPSFTPPGSTIGMVWTLIFILSTLSALFYWNIHKPWGRIPRTSNFWITISLFLMNGILNILWSVLFFGQHNIIAAFFEAIVLGLTVIGLIVLIFPKSKLSSALLLPYAIWVGFASFLTWNVYMLNK